ncbi:MAG: hypothetical protein RLZZ127_1997 [Planctomycetota bacterium]|jgi:hypothetical protein
MSKTAKIIDIRWDEQDPANKGWAYFVEEGKSGPIDGAAAEAIDGILNNIPATADERQAIIRAIGAESGDQVWIDMPDMPRHIDLAKVLGLDA